MKFTELGLVPHNRWFRVLESQQSVVGRKSIEWKDGWINCRADNEVLGFTQLGGSHDLQNIALKGVVRPPDAGKEWQWTFREGMRGAYRLAVRFDRLGLDYDDRSVTPARTIRLREGSFPKELATAAQWSLEATIRGDRFSVSLNGREVFSQDKLNFLEPGACWLRPGNSGAITLKDVFFKVLDDTVESPVAGGAASPPGGIVTFRSHRYQMIPDKLRWTEAKARAESMGGHLATITSREECEWISSTFVKFLPVGLGIWLGGTDAGTPSKWRWITGEGFAFTSWLSGEPNNRTDESALLFSRDESGQIGWLDLKDDGIGLKDRRAGFLVEMDDLTVSTGESTVLPSPRKWVDVKADAGSSSAPFRSAKLEDVAGKMRFLGGEGAQLQLRVAKPLCYRAIRTRDRLLIEVFDTQANKVVRQLAVFDHLPALAESSEHEMVFAARGEILAAWMDGKYAGSARDAELKSGAVGYQPPGGKELRTLEFADLGNGDAGATLVSAATPPSSPEKSAAAVASRPESSSLSTAPASEYENRLAQIESQFQTAYDRDIGKAHTASVSEFNTKYLAALDRAIAASTKEGRLEEVLKLREEKQRIMDKQPLPPPGTDASQPESLKGLRGTYRSTLGKMEAERDRKAGPYYDRYDQLLEAYQKELTQQQKYDDAIKVKSLRIEWSAKRPKADGGGPSS